MKSLHILLFLIITVIYGQPGRWSSFFSFNEITGVYSGSDGQVYGIAKNNFFSFDPDTN